MFQRLNHRLIFASGFFLLLICGSATAWILYRFYFGEAWVRHTYDVELLIAQIESDVSETGRSRQMFLQSGDTRYLERVEAMRAELFHKLPQLREMVHDNLDEETTSEKLEQAVKSRFSIVDESLQLVKSGKSTHEAQDDYSADLVLSSQRTRRARSKHAKRGSPTFSIAAWASPVLSSIGSSSFWRFLFSFLCTCFGNIFAASAWNWRNANAPSRMR